MGEQWSQTGEPAGDRRMRWSFVLDVYDEATVERLIDRLRRVLMAHDGRGGGVVVTCRSESPVVVGGFFDEDEHSQLFGWGDRAVLSRPVCSAVSIPVLFAAQWLAHRMRWR